MFNRFDRIYREFGTKTLAKTILLLVGLSAMSLIGAIAFASPWAAVVAVVGLVLGWLLRRTIVDRAESLFWAIPAGLFIFGIVLFLGERLLGMSREVQLLIITATTVLLFGIQFWSLSDNSIVNTERETEE